MLDKNDLKQIKEIVQGSEKRLDGKIVNLDKKIGSVDNKIDTVEQRLNQRIKDSENRVIAVITREIVDLAEINREVIKKVDVIGELDRRITRLETKLGVK